MDSSNDDPLTIDDLRHLRDLPYQVKKFYKRRHFLFSKYSQGIQLDTESWYSVIPEVIPLN